MTEALNPMALDECIKKFPRYPLSHWPTPLAPLARLQSRFAGPRLFIKRDDCTILAMGGNKTRKLEFLVADALKAGADTLVTHGAVQSNHVRQTAAAAAAAGLACDALLEHRVACDDSQYGGSGNVLLDRMLGAVLHPVPGGTDMNLALTDLARRLVSQGRKPYLIPGGGSNALGALGYVECVRELAQQCAAFGLSKPHLVVASGSAGTHAGLAAGLHALGLPWRLSGVGVRFPRAVQETKVLALANQVLELLGLPGRIPASSIRADDGFIGDGYGLPALSTLEALELLARVEGILLDPVYTGKAMAGLLSMLQGQAFAADEEVVFIHTGGAPALFGYRWALPIEDVAG